MRGMVASYLPLSQEDAKMTETHNDNPSIGDITLGGVRASDWLISKFGDLYRRLDEIEKRLPTSEEDMASIKARARTTSMDIAIMHAVNVANMITNKGDVRVLVVIDDLADVHCGHTSNPILTFGVVPNMHESADYLNRLIGGDFTTLVLPYEMRKSSVGIALAGRTGRWPRDHEIKNIGMDLTHYYREGDEQ